MVCNAASQEQVERLRTLPQQLDAAQAELAQSKERALAEEARLQVQQKSPTKKLCYRKEPC